MKEYFTQRNLPDISEWLSTVKPRWTLWKEFKTLYLTIYPCQPRSWNSTQIFRKMETILPSQGLSQKNQSSNEIIKISGRDYITNRKWCSSYIPSGHLKPLKQSNNPMASWWGTLCCSLCMGTKLIVSGSTVLIPITEWDLPASASFPFLWSSPGVCQVFCQQISSSTQVCPASCCCACLPSHQIGFL